MKDLSELIENKIKAKISWEENRVSSEKNQMNIKKRRFDIWAERFGWVKSTLFESSDFRKYFVSAGKEDSFAEEYDYKSNLSLFSKSSDLNDYQFIIDLKMANVYDQEVMLEMELGKNNGANLDRKRVKHLFITKNNEGWEELDEFENFVLDQISEYIADLMLKDNQEYQAIKSNGL